MLELLQLFILLLLLNSIYSEPDELDAEVISRQTFMQWPNAKIPFYIESEHFDSEQSLKIMKALSNFAFKTCLKFAPVMVRPKEGEHVMLFINPDGTKRCKIETSGHSVFSPHHIHLGYECLQSPEIDMMIMRALGFPFEHNRMIRDLYIKVFNENIEPSVVELFTKDNVLPAELRTHPYDINSVMHFGQRDYSKNGHRTIAFKLLVADDLDSLTRSMGERKALNPKLDVQQSRKGLSKNDLKKIQMVYGPECQKRERQEKIEMCQSYPGVVRKKRDIETTVETVTLKSLRANRDITPPEPIIEDKADNIEAKPNEESEISKIITTLGIEDEAQDILDHIYKISAKALHKAREKYCNSTDVYKPIAFAKNKRNNSDILGILEYITEYADNMIANAVSNLTVFCQNADSIADYQRQKCNWRFDSRCMPTYRSTQSGRVMYSTNHRPFIVQSTKHRGQAASYSYDKVAWRARNDSEEATTAQIQIRKKREALVKDKFVSNSESKKDMIVKEEDAISKTNLTRIGSGIGRRLLQSQHKTEEKFDKLEEDSESRISNEANSALETKRIQEPPSLTFNSANMLFKNGHQTQYFGEPTNNIAEFEENAGKELEKEDTEEDTAIVQEDKNPLKNNFKDIFSVEERKKIKAKRLEKTSRDAILFKNRAVIEAPPKVKLSKLNREFYNERRWPEGVIRYVISPLEGYDLTDMRDRLSEVADILKSKTCVKLVEVSEEEAKNYEDYLVLDTSPDYVTGRVGGRQHFGCVELFKGGQHRQHAAMMVMAMLGFYFEVARHDRDKYIRVHMRHVRPDKLHHFEKIRDDATLDLPYDFKSATHPAWQFWRKIGKTGISTVATYKTMDPDGSIMRSLGQHEQLLSNYDIIKINSIYDVDCFMDPE